MIVLGPTTVSSATTTTYRLEPQSLDPYDEVDLSNETSVTVQIIIGGNVYLLGPQSSNRYPIELGVTQLTVTTLTIPTISGTIFGVAYTSQDPRPGQVAKGSNFLGGSVGLPIDPLVLGAFNSIVLGTQASGDTVDRFKLWADGTHQWGAGNAPPDTQLSRTASGVLTLTGSLVATANLTANGTLTVTGAAGITGSIVGNSSDNFFGTGANGVTNGSRIRLSAAADANAYVLAESANLADVVLHLRSKGTGAIRLETSAGVNMFSVSSTGAATLAGTLSAPSVAIAGTSSIDLFGAGRNLNFRPALGDNGANMGIVAQDWNGDTNYDGLLINGSDGVGIGTSAGVMLKLIGSTGMSTFAGSGGVNVSSGGLQVTGSISGYNNEIRFNDTGDSRSSGLSTNSINSPPMVFDHRANLNTGYWLWRNGNVAANTRMTLTAGGSLSTSGNITAASTGGNAASFLDNDAHSWESDGAGGWRFANRWGINAAIFRFYGGNPLTELARFDYNNIVASDTALWLEWCDNAGTKAFSQVRLNKGSDIRTGIADSLWFLRVI